MDIRTMRKNHTLEDIKRFDQSRSGSRSILKKKGKFSKKERGLFQKLALRADSMKSVRFNPNQTVHIFESPRRLKKNPFVLDIIQPKKKFRKKKRKKNSNKGNPNQLSRKKSQRSIFKVIQEPESPK